jgi:UDP-N-acetylmuramate--alanine ligase
VPAGVQAVFEPSWSAVAERVAAAARPGDLVLTVGAGDVTQLGPEILAAVQAAETASRLGG